MPKSLLDLKFTKKTSAEGTRRLSGQDVSAAYTEIESQIIDHLIERIGDDRFDLWFEGRNSIHYDGTAITVYSIEYFAQNRIKNSFIDDFRQASIAALGRPVEIHFKLSEKLVGRNCEMAEVDVAGNFNEAENGNSGTHAVPPSNIAAISAPSSCDEELSSPPVLIESKESPTIHSLLGKSDSVQGSSVQGSSVQGNLQQDNSERRENRAQVLLKFPDIGQPDCSADSNSASNSAYSNSAYSNSADSNSADSNSADSNSADSNSAGRPQTRKILTSSRNTPRHSGDIYSLDHFRFGTNNDTVKSAVKEIINRPGAFSPLYLFGPVGCGKSHLLRGIVSAYRNRRMSRCIYMTAEQFTSNFVEAIDGRGVSDFRRKCRGLEALAIDDIQFLGGKRATLIEFQSTIEALVREGKQIILTGDCSLPELRGFDPELINRLAGGLPCSINYVNQECRVEILQQLCRDRDLQLDQEVMNYLACSLGKDVRHLSGALNRVQAAMMSGIDQVDVESVHHLILDLVTASRSSVTIRQIESAVGEFCGVPARELRSNSRNKTVSTARMLAMFLSRRLTGCAYAEIGQHFGGRSHSTVISANKKIDKWMERNHFISVNYTECPVSEVVSRIESILQIG